MDSKNTSRLYSMAPITLAMLAVTSTIQAEENSEVQQLITPDSFASIGVGAVSRDIKRFGQYNGMNQLGTYDLVDFEFIKRDNEIGKWTIVKGRNLGLDTRELELTQHKQGDWKYTLELNEMIRHDPYTIHTGMSGIGTANPVLNLIANPLPDIPGTWGATGAGSANEFIPSNGIPGSDVELKIKRSAVAINAEKRLSTDLMIEFGFRNEEKKGARMFGRAGLASDQLSVGIPTLPLANGNWAVLLTPEPIHSSIKQFDFKANYSRENYALSGGYYGSFYINSFGNLSPTVPGTLNRGPLTPGGTPAGALSIQQLASSPIALPPDNQAHQLYLTGKWNYSTDTHSNFKLAYTNATQNTSFSSQGLTPTAPNAPASLGGVVNTTLAHFGINTRATKKLSINTVLHYENRNDQTPVHVYNIGAGGAGLDNTTNWTSASQSRTMAKLDGTYRMGKGYITMLGINWEKKETPLPPANTAIFPNQVFLRPTMNEYGFHIDIRKNMSSSLNGALGAEYKTRTGSGDWVTTSTLAGAPILTVPETINRVLPDMYMDRKRSKLKVSVDWAPTNDLSLQTVLEHSRDDYNRNDLEAIVANTSTGVQASPVLAGAPIPGARTISIDSLSLDGSYAMSEKWQLNAYWTHSESRWNVNKVNLYDDTRIRADLIGVGIKGKLKSKMEIGLDLVASQDMTTFNNVATTAAGTQNIVGFNGTTDPGGNYLPQITTTSEKLNLHGKYGLEKNADVLMSVIYQHFRTNDWQWGYKGIPFIYSDNTTVSQPTDQYQWFFGANYILKF